MTTRRGSDGTTMTLRDDETWECSAGCPFVFQVDESQDDVAYHLGWHAQERAEKVIVHRAQLAREAKVVTITFEDGRSWQTAYRKSWSLKKYLDAALSELSLTPAWDMHYAWSLC